MNYEAAEQSEHGLIVHINGPFGVGKSTVANALVRALPPSILFDPEEVGVMVKTLTSGVRFGEEDTDDFQDIALWRHLTVQTAVALWRRYKRPLIMPMTVWRSDYLEELYVGFRHINMRVEAICLMASVETIWSRLNERGDRQSPWLIRVTEACQKAFPSGQFGQRITTEGRNPQTVAEEVLSTLARRGIKGTLR